MLEVGIKAPDFELPDQNGKIHRLSDYTGKKVILYFYPKDNTAGHKNFGWSGDDKNVDGYLINPYSSQTTAHILDVMKEGAIHN